MIIALIIMSIVLTCSLIIFLFVAYHFNSFCEDLGCDKDEITDLIDQCDSVNEENKRLMYKFYEMRDNDRIQEMQEEGN